MGSTIAVARKVGAIKANDGHIYYALFEKTYESNCHPHDPSWCCIGFGSGPDMVRRIFMFAGLTCGGMLRRPGGQFTPTGYVSSWMTEMKNPLRICDVSVDIKVVDKEFPSQGQLIRSELDRALAALREQGLQDEARRLETEDAWCCETLSEGATVLAAVVRDAMAWRFIHERALSCEQHPELGWNPPAAVKAPNYDLPGRYRIAHTDELVVERNERLEIGPPKWRMEEEFVSAYGALEARSPGHYRKAFKALKAHLDDLPTLSENARVVIDQSKARRGFSGCAETLAGFVGPDGGLLSQIPASDRYRLRYMGDALSLVLSEEPSSTVTMAEQQALEL